MIISHFVGTNNIFVYCMYYTDHAGWNTVYSGVRWDEVIFLCKLSI